VTPTICDPLSRLLTEYIKTHLSISVTLIKTLIRTLSRPLSTIPHSNSTPYSLFPIGYGPCSLLICSSSSLISSLSLITIITMTTILPLHPDLPDLCMSIPKLCSTTWMEFKSAMENLFLCVDCDYLINPTPSTTIPPQCSLLDMWLLCAIYPKVDEDFMTQTQDNMSALHTWLTLCHLHDPPSVVPTPQLVVTTPIPDDSYATVRTSTPDFVRIRIIGGKIGEW